MCGDGGNGPVRLAFGPSRLNGSAHVSGAHALLKNCY